MTLIKADSQRKDILMGAYVSKRVHSYFTLYTLAKRTSKSKVFNELFLDWISQQKEIDTETDLLKQIIVNIQKIRNKSKNRDTSLDVFKKVVEAELTAKGVALNYIAIILSEII